MGEYGLPIDYEPTRFTICRWIDGGRAGSNSTKFIDAHLSSMARDLDGAPVFMAANNFNLQYEIERAKGITFSDVKDYQKKAA